MIQTGFVIDYEWKSEYEDLDLETTKTFLESIDVSLLFVAFLSNAKHYSLSLSVVCVCVCVCVCVSMCLFTCLRICVIA